MTVVKALANDKRLQILAWLKDPRSHFPPQVYGDLVKDGVCGVFIADKLGVPYESIEIRHGDTADSPMGYGTYGSRSLAVGGMSVLKSCHKVVDKARKLAAHVFEASEEDIVVDQERLPYAGTCAWWAGPASALGLPATVVPAGLAPGGTEGLPVGMQVVGPYLGDLTTLAFAEFTESVLGRFSPSLSWLG